jgi:hypothetical protein
MASVNLTVTRSDVVGMIHQGRFTAEHDGDLVVFLIGARIHQPWRVREWWPVAKAMTAMQREIAEHPEIGCLHVENYGMLRSISVQYWRSFEDLERFARSRDWSHLEAWRALNQLMRRSDSVGFWHETYQVTAGRFEAVYGNLPRMGLAAAGRHLPAGPTSTAAKRIGARQDARSPVEAS